MPRVALSPETPAKLLLLWKPNVGPMGTEAVGPGVALAVLLTHSAVEKLNQKDLTAEELTGTLAGTESLCGFRLIPADSKSSVWRVESAFADMTQELQKVAALKNIKCLGALTKEPFLKNFQAFGLRAILLPETATSQDFRAAEKIRDLIAHQELHRLKWQGFSELLSGAANDHDPVFRFASKHGIHSQLDPQAPSVVAGVQESRRKKKLLLHVCCGPDAAGVMEQLKTEFDLVTFWYDPNIQPKAEHDLRLAAFEKVTKILETPSIIGEYDVDRFFEQIEGLEATPEQGAKCSKCYDMRLDRAALEAKKQGCDLFTTTLAISPHKVQRKLKQFGEIAASKYGVPYLARNFMKHDGFKDSVEFTKEHDIYRQDYCGCYFSLHEGGPVAQNMAKQLGLESHDLQRADFKNPFINKIPLKESENETGSSSH